MRHKTAILLFMVAISLPLNGQELDSLATGSNKIIDLGYIDSKQNQFAGSVRSIETQEFNEGNINDPMLLIRNRVAGLGVYKKGSNPNERPHFRIRGLSSLGRDNEPLIVIDGVMGASLDNVDPQDIASFTVLKSAAATALYGMRAGSGVILVSTKSGENEKGFSVDYRSYIAASTLSNPIPALNAAEYVAAGGNDQGSATNWLDEVSRTGFSQMHHLSIGGGNGQTSYRVSLNGRSIDGILKKSGFDQVNTRANISHRAMNDRLKLNFNLSLTQRESQYSFNEAFRYAAVFNPTAPVRFESGDFWQPILFDNYNPVAVIELNENDGKNKLLNYHFAGSYEVLPGLKIQANYAQQYINELNGQFYHSQSFFRGSWRDGHASRSWRDQQLTQFESFASYQPYWAGRFKWTLTAGYSFTQQFEESLSMDFSNLATDELGYFGIDLSADRVLGQEQHSYQFVEANASPVERVVGFFGHTQVTPLEGVNLSLSLRRDGSTRLGKNNRWSMFYALGTNVDMLQFLPIESLSALNLRVDHGETGNLPYTYGLSQAKYLYSFDGGGLVWPSLAPNESLGSEKSKMTNIGLDVSILDNRIGLSLDRYWRTNHDFPIRRWVDPDNFNGLFTLQIQNFGEMKTTGIDLAISAVLFEEKDFNWYSNLVLSSPKTLLTDFVNDKFTLANLGAPGPSSSTIKVAVGEEIGQIWSPVFNGLDDDGFPMFVDINKDGEINGFSGSAIAIDGDFTKTGSGFPVVELGWGNQFTVGNLDLNLFFRGAFGHSLINTYRHFYENVNPGSINSYNRIRTKKAVEGMTSSYFSSLVVEKADFLRLDNLTVGYTFQTDPIPAVDHLRVFTTVENAFTLTHYTGADPEPSMRDFGPTDNGGQVDNRFPLNFAPGIDRRNLYYTARTFLIGLEAKF